eukprot:SAG31_NODE_16740_length_698_cov_0.766277_1_plen_27_part_10
MLCPREKHHRLAIEALRESSLVNPEGR